MLIQQKIGNIQSLKTISKKIDLLPLAWYETNKRILHKRTVAGREITFRFLQHDPGFSDGDIVFENNEYMIVIDIMPSDAMVIRPRSMQQMACVCYEIGNKHLPLFIDADEVLVPYEAPLFQWLTVNGFEPVRESRKLSNAVKTTTIAHSHAATGTTLFSKILQLTKNTAND